MYDLLHIREIERTEDDKQVFTIQYMTYLSTQDELKTLLPER